MIKYLPKNSEVNLDFNKFRFAIKFSDIKLN